MLGKEFKALAKNTPKAYPTITIVVILIPNQFKQILN